MSYQYKDQVKFKPCTKLISRGAQGSSSYWYAQDPVRTLGINVPVNADTYTKDDLVGISVNGNRHNRVAPDYDLIKKAADAGVRFVTDNSYHRNRPFNVGEREVAAFLTSLGYSNEETPDGCVWWKP
jgi:hypothetical protein